MNKWSASSFSVFSSSSSIANDDRYWLWERHEEHEEEMRKNRQIRIEYLHRGVDFRALNMSKKNNMEKNVICKSVRTLNYGHHHPYTRFIKLLSYVGCQMEMKSTPIDWMHHFLSLAFAGVSNAELMQSNRIRSYGVISKWINLLMASNGGLPALAFISNGNKCINHFSSEIERKERESFEYAVNDSLKMNRAVVAALWSL